MVKQSIYLEEKESLALKYLVLECENIELKRQIVDRKIDDEIQKIRKRLSLKEGDKLEINPPWIEGTFEKMEELDG